jgi:hypothetical protein
VTVKRHKVGSQQDVTCHIEKKRSNCKVAPLGLCCKDKANRSQGIYYKSKGSLAFHHLGLELKKNVILRINLFGCHGIG